MDITTSLGLIASGIAVTTAIYGVCKYIRNLIMYLSLPDYLTGLYTGFYIQNQTSKINFDVVEIKKKIGGLMGRTIYAHSLNFDYHFTAYKLQGTKNVYEGKWHNQHTKKYMGSFQFRIIKEGSNVLIVGGWIGPNEEERIKFGDWKLRKSEIQELPKKLEPKKKNERILEDIIRRHESEPECVERIKNLRFSIPKGVFNPIRGKISIPLMEKVKDQVGFPDLVLDLGCGCGLYALYFAQYGEATHVFASDSNRASLNAAKLNASYNRVEDKITFIESRSDQIYHGIPKDKKFDLIIANLPFTAKENCIKYENSPYFHCFSADSKLYFNLVLGAQFHLKDNGFLFFTFGESGYEDELHDFLGLANLQYTIVERRVEKDDVFLIYKAWIKESLSKRWS
ncbi:methyltransferase [Gimesia aquarii]|uniref:N5-glutamine S-adenosyl-L-methionine-dependent methyltransferase n=1 Tax=Gimesia aquarii TaxID=2527964 RepID=A0A517WSB8_9PLAN|nr:methyltransferase [Gimesia aquarii]QDU08157.1 N5-glutamine S-adenosyl-L-methionine-dependent methyltransferase [Gimesia aquarii]